MTKSILVPLDGSLLSWCALPYAARLASRAHWIAHTLRPRGIVVVDDGAALAVRDKGRSLLPSGITAVRGGFRQGDPVDLADARGEIFARGLSVYSATELETIRGKKAREIITALGYHLGDEAVHKDDLVVLERGGAAAVDKAVAT